MNNRQRLLDVLQLKPTDRVPISTYELCGYNSVSFENKEPSYNRLMEYIRKNTDTIAMWEPFSNMSLANNANDFGIVSVVNKKGNETIIDNSVKIGNVTLRQSQKIFDNIMTVWQTKHWCETPDDVDALLSVDFVPATYDFSDKDRIISEVGNNGIVMPTIMDAMCVAADLMSFENFTIWAMTEQEHFKRTLDVLHERLMVNLERQLKSGVMDLYRIVGGEYANTPYLPPYLYNNYVTCYDKEIVDLAHSYGAKVRFHAHGRVGEHLDDIISMGVDAIDPVEDAPDGNTTLNCVKEKLSGKMCVFGNIQLKLLETASPEQVVETTKKAMDSAKYGGGFVIMPTASPINIPLAQKTEENYYAFIETALKEGKY